MKKSNFRLENLFSRKFIVTMSCIFGAISLINSGAYIAGVCALVSSCAGYLVAEGVIDIKNIRKISELYDDCEAADITEDISDIKDFDL